MRSEDALHGGEREPFGIRLGGVQSDGRDRLHYPDLLLVDGRGHRIAVELELSSKSRIKRDGIMRAYAASAGVDAVLYLVETEAMARTIRTAAAAYGTSDRLHVQYVRLPGRAGGGRNQRVAGRSGGRSPQGRAAARSSRAAEAGR
jgi:hypothetical protein